MENGGKYYESPIFREIIIDATMAATPIYGGNKAVKIR
jgi:hypothetical protein